MHYSLGSDKPCIKGVPAYIAPNATLVGRVTVHQDTSVWFNAVLRGDCDTISVGAGSNVQDGAVLHADFGFPVSVGEGVTIGHKAMLHGCTIGRNVLIGMNATILNGAVIGDNCVIGANALIAEGKVIPPNSVVIGVPGRCFRQVTDAEVEKNQSSARYYVANGHRYRAELKEVP